MRFEANDNIAAVGLDAPNVGECLGLIAPETHLPPTEVELLWVRALGTRAGSSGNPVPPKWAHTTPEHLRIWREAYGIARGRPNENAKPRVAGKKRGW